jgi:hypothetical protein
MPFSPTDESMVDPGAQLLDLGAHLPADLLDLRRELVELHLHIGGGLPISGPTLRRSWDPLTRGLPLWAQP